MVIPSRPQLSPGLRSTSFLFPPLPRSVSRLFQAALVVWMTTVGKMNSDMPHLTISVPCRLCLQWRRWILCLWSECQWLRLGDDQVHESRWCQRASWCAGESQVHLYGLDPWRQGDVLQLIPTAGWEEWRYVTNASGKHVIWDHVASYDWKGSSFDWHCVSNLFKVQQHCCPQVHAIKLPNILSHCLLFYIWLHSSTACDPRCSGSLEATDRLVIVIGLRRLCLLAVILLFLFYFILFFGVVCKSLSDYNGGVYDRHKQFILCFLPAFLKEWVSLKIIKCFLHFGNTIYCPDSLVHFHNEKIKFSLLILIVFKISRYTQITLWW